MPDARLPDREATPAPGDPIFAVLMDSAPPRMTAAEAESLLLRHWGLAGRAVPVACERDANFHIRTAAGDYVLKIANPAEPVAETAFQTAALRWLERSPGVPVPRVIPGRDGLPDRRITLSDGRESTLRLLGWVPGVPLARAGARPAGVAEGIGAMLAGLGRALRDFDHPAAGRELLWDIRHAARLRPLLPAVGADLRPLLTAELDRFAAEVAPRLPGLRRQVVHNDMNHHNLVVDPADPGRITGVLDFGDMVCTPLIIDLAVAASYLIHGSDDPLAPVLAITRAYHAVTPLWPEETALLRDLIVARLVTSVTISEWRAAAMPHNADYILRNNLSARDGLRRFATLPRDKVRAALTME